MGMATCHTDGCGNAGIPLDVGPESWPDGDETMHRGQVFCGVCGQEITDVDDDTATPA